MVRYCDKCIIARHGGTLYDPFSEETNMDEPAIPGIWKGAVYNGPCKAVQRSQNAMMAVSERANYVITIPDPTLDVDVRDDLYLQNNGVGQMVKMVIVEVKPYERNIIINAFHNKDGENSI